MTFHASSEAEKDYVDVVSYYLEEDTPHTAERFSNALANSYREIKETPLLFAADKDGIRRKPIKGFPEHSVTYRVTGDAIEIIAIRHHKRKPGFWQKRL